jgi:AraC-like DNA-binding protein
MVAVATEHVRIWRPDDEGRVLLMAGQTTHYAVDPRGEYVFGVVTDESMRSRRGRQTYLVRPGQLVAWDPSAAHTGTAADGRPWTSRLMVVETGDLAALAIDDDDEEANVIAGIAFPDPVLDEQDLARGFLRLHGALEAPASRLERDDRLAEWLRTLVRRSPAVRIPRPQLSPRDDRALRRACDYLGDQPGRNVGLDELAAVAGVGKFRLVRLIRERTGLPPHALQIAHRVRAARRLLEAGLTPAEAAAATGFADQSHLHRHFQRSLGVTPREYQRRLDGLLGASHRPAVEPFLGGTVPPRPTGQR